MNKLIMNKLWIATFIILCSLSNTLYASVFIAAGLPKSFDTWYDQAKTSVQEAIKELNKYYTKKSFGIKLGFKPLTYQPHITLNYIVDQKINLKDFLASYPQSDKILASLADSLNPINITKNFKQAKIEFWPAQKSIKIFGGQVINNSLWVVIELVPLQELTKLSDEISQKLSSMQVPQIKYDFKAHITLGQLYNKFNQADIPLQDIKNQLVARFKELLSKYPHSLKINALALKSGQEEKRFVIRTTNQKNLSEINTRLSGLQANYNLL